MPGSCDPAAQEKRELETCSRNRKHEAFVFCLSRKCQAMGGGYIENLGYMSKLGVVVSR